MSAVCCWSLVRDQEVEGSNPSAPTKHPFKINYLQIRLFGLLVPRIRFALFVHRGYFTQS